MGWASVVIFLVVIQAISPSLASRPVEQDVLSFMEGTCEGVDCGKGKCEIAGKGTLEVGYVCECDPGWSQLLIDDRLRFLPCVIPNCTLSYQCNHDSAPPATPAPFHSLQNLSLFDPCLWSYCGEGTCVRESSGFGHQCECNEGFNNLVNITSLPCFRDCVVGADCPNLGFPLSLPPFPSSPPYFSHRGASSAPKSSMWWSILGISIAMV